MKIKEGDLVKIEGGYQHHAIEKGFIVQRIWHELKIDLIDRVMPPDLNDVILDIGCGSGNITNYLAAKSKQVTGVDANEEAILYAKQTFVKSGLSFKHALIDQIDFRDETFTKIYILELIEHIYAEQIKDFFSECYRLLKQGGEILLTTPNKNSLWPIIEKTLDFLTLAPKMSGVQHVTQLNRTSLSNMIPHDLFNDVFVGKYCGVAPFLGILGKNFAYKINEIEFKLGSPLGNLFFLTCKKK